MTFRNSTIVATFLFSAAAFMSTPAFAAIQVGDTASFDTNTVLTLDGKPQEEHSTVTDVVKAIATDGSIQFEETRKTDSSTTTETVSYSEANWLMAPDDGPQTGEEILNQCGSFPNSKKVPVSLKTGDVEGCDVMQTDASYSLHIIYAPVPLYIYGLEYHDMDETNKFDLTQQFIEEP